MHCQGTENIMNRRTYASNLVGPLQCCVKFLDCNHRPDAMNVQGIYAPRIIIRPCWAGSLMICLLSIDWGGIAYYLDQADVGYLGVKSVLNVDTSPVSRHCMNWFRQLFKPTGSIMAWVWFFCELNRHCRDGDRARIPGRRITARITCLMTVGFYCPLPLLALLAWTVKNAVQMKWLTAAYLILYYFEVCFSLHKNPGRRSNIQLHYRYSKLIPSPT